MTIQNSPRAMLLASVSDIRDGLLAAGKLRYFDWTMNLESEGVAAIGEETLFMTAAFKVQVFMAQIGMVPQLNAKLGAMLRHAVFGCG